MSIYCLGSINIDHFYRLPHLPAPGETLATLEYESGLGGKGANQSVAAARAGACVTHIGMVGAGAEPFLGRMVALGVNVDHVHVAPDQATGHALVMLDTDGENSIVIHPGANRAQDRTHLATALAGAGPGDLLMLQNETDLQVEAAEMARAKGMGVLYSAAPFSAEAVEAVMPHVTILAVNAVEAAQLSAALGRELGDLPVDEIIVTHGGDGAEWLNVKSGERIRRPAHKVTAVDTTGAGDTFAGYFAAGRDQGIAPAEALDWAIKAAALKVTRRGSAEAIPTADEVKAFK